MIYTYQKTDIYYETAGIGRPIILLHGLGGDMTLMKACFEPVFSTITGFQRIYIDLPGMGKSAACRQLASSDEILNMLCQFIKDQIHSHFLLAGESYGGYLARGILTRYPDDTDALLLLCPVIHADHAKRTLPGCYTRFRDKAFPDSPQQDKENFGEYGILLNEYTRQRYTKEILTGLQKTDKTFAHILKKQHYDFCPDTENAIRNIYYTKPVLFICGRQDICTGYLDAWNLIENYPRASFAVLDAAGHNLQIEQPALFESLTADWLERVKNYPNSRFTKVR